MSRAFVKEDAQGPYEDPPEKPVSSLPNYVTPRGLKILEDEEVKLVKELGLYAGAQEDPLKKKRKREFERDLRYVRARLEAAIPVDPANQPNDQVRFGATVVLQKSDGAKKTIRIVGEDEADEGGEMLRWSAPFAEALFGLKIDQPLSCDGESWTVASINY